MITIRYASFIKIFLITTPISVVSSMVALFLLFSVFAVFTKEWILSPDFWGTIVGGGIVFGVYLGLWFGVTMRGLKVSMPIEWNTQSFLEILKKTLPQCGFEFKHQGATSLIYKKRPPIPVLYWEAQIEFDKNIIKLEGPKSYVVEMKKVVEIIQETLKAKSNLAT